jgi:ribosome-binding protein aMBF1 (putative translation factor)
MDGQDWAPVTLRSSKAIAQKTQTTRSNLSETVVQAKKIDNGDIGKFKVLTTESRQAMALARSVKKLTQKQLDALGQFPANSCNSWEAGKMCPTGAQLNKLHRLLGVKFERS